jgi:hypothetical protein
MSEQPYEHVTYRVEWVFKLGWIGDSEGRTWAKDLKEETVFPTQAEAQAYRDTHPDMVYDTVWKEWKAKHCYGLWAIEKRLAQVDVDPALQARIAAAEAMAEALRNAEVTIQNLINVMGTPDQQLCCNGHMCGCMGATVYQEAKYYAGKDLKAASASLASWEAGR